jgi:hypothetical protein
MPRACPRLLAAAVPLLLAVPLPAQQAPPRGAEGDVTSPALLKMIRERFATKEGLRESDGVEIRETRFFQGTVRVTGTVVRQEQIDQVRRTLDALRAELGAELDIRITAIDVSGLTVRPAPKPGEPGDRLRPVPATEPPEESPVVSEEPAGIGPGAGPAPPPHAPKRFHWGHKKAPAAGGHSPAWDPYADDGVNAFTNPNCYPPTHHWFRWR